MQTAYQWTGHWNYSKNDIAQTVFAEYLCYRNTLHKFQDYVAVKSINQYHVNICRSPMAEFVMKDLVEKAGISAQFEIVSAATSTEEIGNPVYPPARRKLAGRRACQHCQNAAGWTLL